MMNYSNIQLPVIILGFIMFAIAEILLIRGYKKYNYSLAWVLAPFAGIIFGFPVYFGLKEKALKEKGDQGAAKSAHKQLIVAVWAVAITVLWIIISTVCSIMPAFETGSIDAQSWARLLYIGLYTISVLFLITVLLLRKK